MATRYTILDASYQPDQKRLEILIGMSDVTEVQKTTTIKNLDTGEEKSIIEEPETVVNKGFGDTLYCPDAAGHTHEPNACAKAHPEFAAKTAALTAKLTDWQARAKRVTVVPVSRKLD